MTPKTCEIIGGGFFGGVINVNGARKGVIWAPKREGEIRSILLPADKIATGAGSPNDCAANTKALLDAGSPAAQHIAGLSINGFQDWLIPSRDVLELGYRHFKPTGRRNYCGWRDGENANSVPPGWLYTDKTPAQTALDAFREGGHEAFGAHWYWSSTVLPDGDTAFIQNFLYGSQIINILSAESRVRAVRLIHLDS